MHASTNTDWAQKYRPRTLQEMVLPSALARKLVRVSEEGGGMSLLFHGPPGTGKTAAASVINPTTLLHVHCSKDRSIATVKTIVNKCGSMCAYGRRVIVLDEIDDLTSEAQGALEGAIEHLSVGNDFIGTTNHIDKVSEALQSRLYPVSFDHHSDNGYTEQIKCRLRHVLTTEGRSEPPPAVLGAIVREEFPDIRRMLKRLQFETA